MVNKGYLNLAFLTATVLLLNGCSFLSIGQGDFSCPGGIEGVRCMSARQVYQATESSDYVKTLDENDKGSDSGSRGVLAYSNATRNSQVAVPSIEQPVPIRTQAQVMRIWVAPWEDDDGDLHADGYLYTEIESRRWNLGERFRSPGRAISPLSDRTPR
ncbi:type IV conjugative transfer system lipoprotein TraV [Methylicorpusculum sp.]|uniref:type IV conjugative transfer system lipoprotein TraV n=1 Tax=Methylicorpusculum sp. TaxID=2713644 RepID=UPI00271D13E6|nr:type IV conjugative transfer system lipoprotein TraV [Methylicorpusculum sp.]MDO8845339.1 type IV conjugative transfer system lipoprotein TraV [Methylicorpusculum sp.]